MTVNGRYVADFYINDAFHALALCENHAAGSEYSRSCYSMAAYRIGLAIGALAR